MDKGITTDIINELLSIEAFADSLKNSATSLRRKLQLSPAASPSGGLSVEQKCKVVARRQKSILKKQVKP